MVRSVAGNLPEQVKNNQSVNTAAGNGGQKMSQYSWFTVYCHLYPMDRFLLFCHNKRPSYELDFIIEEPLMTYLQKKFQTANQPCLLGCDRNHHTNLQNLS